MDLRATTLDYPKVKHFVEVIQNVRSVDPSLADSLELDLYREVLAHLGKDDTIEGGYASYMAELAIEALPPG